VSISSGSGGRRVQAPSKTPSSAPEDHLPPWKTRNLSRGKVSFVPRWHIVTACPELPILLRTRA
jgi:hypothetical protein